MRIAVSGAVCTGKTTLGKALAARLELPFIEENLDPLFGPDTARGKTPKDVADAVVACLELKRGQETAAGGFVVDRCPLDLMNFWQVNRLPRQCGGHDIYALCERYMAGYDFVVLTPWGGVPFVQVPPGTADRRRTMNPWIQFKGSVVITGFAHHFLEPSRIVQIPRDAVSHDDRLAFVLEAIGTRRRAG